MKKIYAPWRSKYVEESVHTKKDNECVFCKAIKENDDEKNFILKRGKYCTTIMNIYPYNAGHLMIIPNEHKANLSDLSADTRAEIMEEVNFAIEAIKKTLNPSAFGQSKRRGNAFTLTYSYSSKMGRRYQFYGCYSRNKTSFI